MRLAGQAKAGYFPCPPDAVAVALQQLHVVDSTAPLLDPCAGQGAAIKQLADGLRAASEAIHVVELDEGRAAILRETLPDAKVLSPASFMGCKATIGGCQREMVNLTSRLYQIINALSMVDFLKPVCVVARKAS
jgi:hypothetical protein